MAGVSLGLSRTLAKLDNLSFALGAAYDAGGRGSDARNLDAKLAWHRLTVPIEGRYHILPMLYGFVRVSPGAHLSLVSIQDPSAPSRLATSGWSFATDVSLGASVLLGPHRQRSRARVWLTPEIGYMATTDLALALSPQGREDPRPTSSTDLGSLGMRGPFMRVTVDLSF